MHPIVQDLRYGVRSLTKAPSVAIVAVLVLALGTGAGTAIFSVVDAALWKPLPYRDPKGLVMIWDESPALETGRMYVAAANLPAWQQNRSFEGMAEVVDLRINLTGGPNGHIEPEELRAERVSAGMFPLLGVQPSIGRAFQPDEDRPGHTDFVLLSHGLWQRRFGGDKAILGKSIRLRDQSCQVLGVLPAGFSVLDPLTDVLAASRAGPLRSALRYGAHADGGRASEARRVAATGALRNGGHRCAAGAVEPGAE